MKLHIFNRMSEPIAVDNCVLQCVVQDEWIQGLADVGHSREIKVQTVFMR